MNYKSYFEVRSKVLCKQLCSFVLCEGIKYFAFVTKIIICNILFMVYYKSPFILFWCPIFILLLNISIIKFIEYCELNEYIKKVSKI